MVDTCGSVATLASTVFSFSGNTAVNRIFPPLLLLRLLTPLLDRERDFDVGAVETSLVTTTECVGTAVDAVDAMDPTDATDAGVSRS